MRRDIANLAERTVRSRDLGDGPHRPFGAALTDRHQGTIETPPLITERPRRLTRRQFRQPPCGQCGERIFYCDCDETSRDGAGANNTPPLNR